MVKFQPADVIAFILILGYLGLSYLGKSNELNSAILIVVGFYFGKEHFKPSETQT